MLDSLGKPCFICNRCKKLCYGVSVVYPPRRKNLRGRIAWSRDQVCMDCMRAENNIKEENHEQH